VEEISNDTIARREDAKFKAGKPFNTAYLSNRKRLVNPVTTAVNAVRIESSKSNVTLEIPLCGGGFR
jgi:hypothetical protein